MSAPTVTTKSNNPNYDVSANQWNAVVAATKNHPFRYTVINDSGTVKAINGETGAIDSSSTDATIPLNYATQQGGRVLIKNGLYTLSAGVKYYDNTIIEGESWATILKMGDNVNQPVFYGEGSYTGDNSGNTNVAIRNLQIDGNAANQTTDYVTNGIEYSGLVNGLFDNLYIKDCKFGAICDFGSHYVREAQNIIFQNNYVENCGEGVTFTYVTGLKVSNNYFTGINVGCAVHGEGSFTSDNLNDIHVTDNTILDSTRGIEVATLNTSYGIGVYIQNNHLINITSSGVTLYYIYDYHIIGNTFKNVGAAVSSDPLDYYKRVIGLRNCFVGVIQSNTFTLNDQSEEIYAYSSSRCTIMGNIFYTYTTSYDIVRLENSNRFIVSDNDMQHGVSGNKAVVEVGTSDSNTVKNNYMVGLSLTILGANTIIQDNIGYNTERSSTFTITSSTSVTVNHGLSITPNHAPTITMQTSGYGSVWVTSLTSNQFTINVDNSGDYSGSWSYP